MELDRSGLGPGRRVDQIRRRLEESGIPVFALLPAAEPAAAQFGGYGESDGTLFVVSLVYEAPDGVWVGVDIERFAGTRVVSGPLRQKVEHQMRMHGERLSAVPWSEADATMIVDGRPVAGRMVRAGDRWWAARCRLDDGPDSPKRAASTPARGVEVSVVARDWHPAVVEVCTVADVVPMLSRVPDAPPVTASPAPLPAGLRGEPHRALVEAALQSRRALVEWLADGGAVPELPGYWTELWAAALARQVALSDQPEPAARMALRDLVAQLSDLDEVAEWFRTDDRLRELAINETLLYVTGLTDRVSSRSAQVAWRHGRREAWRQAWAAWARVHSKQVRRG